MEININQFTYEINRENIWAMGIAKKYGIKFSSIRSLEVKPNGENDAYRTITIVYVEVQNYADIVVTQVISEYKDA